MSLVLQSNTRRGLAIPESFALKAIVLESGKPSVWISESGQEAKAECLECPDRPCITFLTEELGNGAFPDLPLDVTLEVCASKAIRWDAEQGKIAITEEQCILCGVCAERCPAKAIYLTELTAVVSLPNRDAMSMGIDRHDASRAILRNALVKGIFLLPTNRTAIITLARIRSIKPRGDLFSPNALVRNLLTILGWKAGSYRQGVQYSAMDVVALKEQSRVVAEVEFNQDPLDVARNLITASATLFIRHGWQPETTILAAIVLRLPNRRTDYWNVLEDVGQVLNLHVRTVTVPALMYLVWLRKHDLDLTSESFILDAESPGLRKALSIDSHQLEGITPKFMSILESYK